MMVAMKAYSSRALNKLGADIPGRRRWARHGSTRYLWTKESIRAAVRYVVDEQGLAMAVYEAPSPRWRSGFGKWPPLAYARGSDPV